MPDLIDVVDKKGRRARVSRSWLDRWPDDFKVAAQAADTETSPATGEEDAEAPAAADDKPRRGDKQKER